MSQHADELFLKALFTKFLENRCTEAEIRLLMDYADNEAYRELLAGWMKEAGMDEGLTDEALYALHREVIDAVGARITQAMPGGDSAQTTPANGDMQAIPPGHPRIRKLHHYRISAAVILLLLAAGAWYWLSRAQHAAVPEQLAQAGHPAKDLPPGSRKAVLILANGASVTLDSASNGVLGRQGHAQVVKMAGGSLVYNAGAGQATGPVYNSVITPRGGQYQVTLSDGTKVWLNAASSLRFPTAFTDSARQVTLTGEAYFEVSKHAGKPFIVTANNTRVTVLGTHFNIMAYADEAAVSTTLLEGAVRVSQGATSTLLQPGQQANVDQDGHIRLVRHADVDAVIAWKNRLFWFDNDDIQTVMRQISREYNIDVVIRGTVSRHFTGSIPRDVNASAVFKVLQKTGGVHFTISEGKIIVTP